MAVFYRVVMDVVEVAVEVVFVGDGVFPIACLPDAPIAPLPAGGALWLLRSAGCQPGFGEFFLDPSPACRIGVIAGWQSPEGVQMLGKQNESMDFKRAVGTTGPQLFAQNCSRHRVEEERNAVRRDEREEIRSTGHEPTSVISHAAPLVGWAMPTNSSRTAIEEMVGTAHPTQIPH